jgi:hypothetical protein
VVGPVFKGFELRTAGALERAMAKGFELATVKGFELSESMLAHASPYFASAFKDGRLTYEHAFLGIRAVVLHNVTIRSFELAISYIFSFEKRFFKFGVIGFGDEGDFISAMIELSSLNETLLIPGLDEVTRSSLSSVLANSDALGNEHIRRAFELLEPKSGTRDAIVRKAFAHFQSRDWELESRNIYDDWKFGEALENVPGFAGAFFILLKESYMS